MAHGEIVELGKLTFSLVIVLLFFTWTAVALRIWVRLGITKSPGWDDATMIMALCLFTCYCAFILVITRSSAAHNQFTSMEALQSLVYVQLSEVFYVLTTTFLKISLGLFFLRILTKPWQMRLFEAILVISAAYGLFYFFATVFVCGDPTKLGANLLGNSAKHCAPTWFVLGTGYIYGIVNVLADWAFTLIPIIILIDSTMDRREKISVGIVIAFAAVGSIASIMRMVYLKGLLFHGSISTASVKATIWATAEPGVGIVAACAAIMRPLFRKIYADVRDKLSEYGTTKSSQQESTVQYGLTSVAATRNTTRLSTNSNRPVEPNDPWDDRVSTEQARIGVGRAVVITAGKDVRTIPLQKK
ncbi:hypothetical protein BU23DRAFT_625473 [Bimuria novae-zelandiae CBS 107.79]|uniref:Rhodopsin domain-containing protein n=1 Tax=Bimuria novae-zelandiae CBS 107.79 TaxID=1447943 RepID=A0A6A5VUN7_9PLEO|nr:hypothetical protein BU23DRAFT_625473 [Bimuria novae-zelandiae CBS 107.79]